MQAVVGVALQRRARGGPEDADRPLGSLLARAGAKAEDQGRCVRDDLLVDADDNAEDADAEPTSPFQTMPVAIQPAQAKRLPVRSWGQPGAFLMPWRGISHKHSSTKSRRPPRSPDARRDGLRRSRRLKTPLVSQHQRRRRSRLVVAEGVAIIAVISSMVGFWRQNAVYFSPARASGLVR